MGIDWEGLLGAEGADLADAYNDSIPEDDCYGFYDDEDFYCPDELILDTDDDDFLLDELPFAGQEADSVCGPLPFDDDFIPEIPPVTHPGMSLSKQDFEALIRSRAAPSPVFERLRGLYPDTELQDILTGKHTLLKYYMIDEYKNYSEYATWAFIDRLMEAMERRRQWLLEDAIAAQPLCELEVLQHECLLTRQQVKFYRSFLYCVLRILGSDIPPWVDHMVAGTFGTLYEVARDEYQMVMKYKTEQQYLIDQQDGKARGFFNLMDNVCHVLDYDHSNSWYSGSDWLTATRPREWAEDFAHYSSLKANWYTCRQLYFQLIDNDDLRRFVDDLESALTIFLAEDGRALL